MRTLFDQSRSFPNGHHDPTRPVKLSVRDFSAWYGDKQALQNVSVDIFDREVTAFIGPSGCGKSTLLKSFNRINETIPGFRVTGDILLDGQTIFDPQIEPAAHRRRFGWVAQAPNPFPWSIRWNVLYGARIHGMVNSRSEEEVLLERYLRQANLWDEVKDLLEEPATSLSGGQQQRLCIARAMSTGPDVMLMDEPCSALDPAATAHVEQLVGELKGSLAIVIITHNLQQAARVSQRTAFFHLGRLIEAGDTEDIILRPKTEQCAMYVTGRYG